MTHLIIYLLHSNCNSLKIYEIGYLKAYLLIYFTLYVLVLHFEAILSIAYN